MLTALRTRAATRSAKVLPGLKIRARTKSICASYFPSSTVQSPGSGVGSSHDFSPCMKDQRCVCPSVVISYEQSCTEPVAAALWQAASRPGCMTCSSENSLDRNLLVSGRHRADATSSSNQPLRLCRVTEHTRLCLQRNGSRLNSKARGVIVQPQLSSCALLRTRTAAKKKRRRLRFVSLQSFNGVALVRHSGPIIRLDSMLQNTTTGIKAWGRSTTITLGCSELETTNMHRALVDCRPAGLFGQAPY